MTEGQNPTWRFEGDGVRIIESRPRVVVLRVLAIDDGLIMRLGIAAGFAWPKTPNTVHCGVHWTGPSEWTLVGEIAARAKALRDFALEDVIHHCAEVGPGRRSWEVSGPAAGDLMARGCGMDLHPNAFGPDACAQTLFAETPALLTRVPDRAFQVLAGADVSEHLRTWFQVAGRSQRVTST
jgi:sarcosine oxidase subunit gamma